jgi:hypothetical protein
MSQNESAGRFEAIFNQPAQTDWVVPGYLLLTGRISSAEQPSEASRAPTS